MAKLAFWGIFQFEKLTRLACHLSFASLFFVRAQAPKTIGTNTTQKYLPKHPWNNPCETHASGPSNHPAAVTLALFNWNRLLLGLELEEFPRGEREFPFPVIPGNTSLKFPVPSLPVAF